MQLLDRADDKRRGEVPSCIRCRRYVAQGRQQLGIATELLTDGPDPERGAEGSPGTAPEFEVLHDGAQNGMARDTCNTEQPVSSGSRVA